MTSSGLDGTHSLADSTNQQSLGCSGRLNSTRSENSSMTNTLTATNVDLAAQKPQPRLYQRQASFVHKSTTFEASLNSLSYLNARGAAVQPENQRSLWSYTAKQLWILAAVAYGNFWVAACVSLQVRTTKCFDKAIIIINDSLKIGTFLSGRGGEQRRKFDSVWLSVWNL